MGNSLESSVFQLTYTCRLGHNRIHPHASDRHNGLPGRVIRNKFRLTLLLQNDITLKPKRFIPVFWSALGAQLRYCGNPVNGFDDVISRAQPHDPNSARRSSARCGLGSRQRQRQGRSRDKFRCHHSNLRGLFRCFGRLLGRS
jgi:hypothetical protein